MFFNTDIVVYNPEINNWTEYSIELMQNNDMIKKIFVDILRALGTGAKDVKVKLEKIKLADLPQELQLPDALKSFLGAQEGNRIEAKVVYDQFEVDLMTEESTGVKRLFQMICPIIDILNKGKILICDELEASVATHLYLGKSVSYSETGTSNFGYRDISFSLALSVVKCQQMFSLAWFRSVSHADSSRRSSSMSAILRERHCRVMTLSSISAMFSQLPCFGV